MESGLYWNVFILVIASICSLVIGAPSSLQCPDSNLNMTRGTYTISTRNGESILRYQCPEGSYPSVYKRTCFGGTWDPAPTRKRPECKRITCPNPNVLDNGVVEPYKPLYYYNDTTTYRCYSDYSFRGSSTRVCQLNGKWSGSTPICSRDSDHCPDPGTPAGASRSGHSFNIDDKVTYRCDDKLKLLGSKERVCQDDSQWSGQEPECYASYTYDTTTEVAEAFGSTLKTTLITHEEKDQQGRKIRLDQKGKLNIYIALDASDSINEDDFEKAKNVIIELLKKISYFEVSPNYEIIVFATEVTKVVSFNDYKGKEKKLYEIINQLKDFKFDDKGDKTGTNIAKAFAAILDTMSFEKTNNKTRFNEIRHVIIMFTDGVANMGGNPKQKVIEIKHLVHNDDEVKRDEYLDIYVFGVGEADDVEKEKIDEWVTKRPNEKHFFLLKDIKTVQKTFDEIIDESTSVGLCGLFRDYDEDDDETRRRRHPWLIKYSVTRPDGKSGNCLGSLVTPLFILTAAHCFKFDDIPEKIQIEKPVRYLKTLEAKDFFSHPKYKPRGKVSEGLAEYYEHDVALIELKEAVKLDTNLRPICIPCTKETSGALKLSSSDVTCKTQKESMLNNDLVKAFFMSAKKKKEIHTKNNVIIKLEQKKDACIEDAKKTLNITQEQAMTLISENFLCTGGEEQNYIDDISCKGDSGGGTFVEQNSRAIQVGVVSWGLKDVCSRKVSNAEYISARDFHIDLFNAEVQDFLQKYLGDEKKDTPLQFLK